MSDNPWDLTYVITVRRRSEMRKLTGHVADGHKPILEWASKMYAGWAKPEVDWVLDAIEARFKATPDTTTHINIEVRVPDRLARKRVPRT